MMSRLSSGVMLRVVEDRHGLRAGEHRLVDVLARDVPSAIGAYLPRVSAPPAPAKLWHMRAVDAEELAARGGVAAGAGRVLGRRGSPGRGRATRRRPRASAICSLAELDRLAPGSATPGSAAGIRPVPTWKSTAAAPTPIRRRARSCVPWALRPWQVAQLARKSFLPLSIDAGVAPWRRRPAVGAGCGVSAAGERAGPRAGAARASADDAGGRRVRSRPTSSSRAAGLAGLAGGRHGSLEEVDGGEQPDPDDVDEVPVVRDDDRAGRLRRGVNRLAAKVRPMTSRKAIRPPVTCRPWKPVVR